MVRGDYNPYTIKSVKQWIKKIKNDYPVLIGESDEGGDNTKKTDSGTTAPETEEPEVNPDGKDPATILTNAKETIKNAISKFQGEIDDFEGDTGRQNKAIKLKKNFQRKSDNLLNTIDKQNKKYSVNPTQASKLDATRFADKALRDIKRLETETSDTISLSKNSKGIEKIKKGAGEIKAGAKESVRKFGNTSAGRGIKNLGQSAVRGMKNAVANADRRGKMISGSQTAGALKDKATVLHNKTKEVRGKLKYKARGQFNKVDAAIANKIQGKENPVRNVNAVKARVNKPKPTNTNPQKVKETKEQLQKKFINKKESTAQKRARLMKQAQQA